MYLYLREVSPYCGVGVGRARRTQLTQAQGITPQVGFVFPGTPSFSLWANRRHLLDPVSGERFYFL